MSGGEIRNIAFVALATKSARSPRQIVSLRRVSGISISIFTVSREDLVICFERMIANYAKSVGLSVDSQTSEGLLD
jgi:hypothetical protein